MPAHLHRDQPQVLGVIPARFASSRLPGKPLLNETGTPLIIHVVEAARRSSKLDRIVVATDDRRIFDAVTAHGAEACMTREDHPSGTDRVAEVASQFPTARIVVNLQGDEPEIEPTAIDRVVDLLERDASAVMSTVATPIRDESIYRDPACVKVVLAESGRALYFSRSPIPMHRDGLSTGRPLGLLHLGLYAYRRDFLLSLASLPPSPLEQSEKLEQLRVLESGQGIAVGVVDERCVGIDTPEDYRRFVERWNRRRGTAA